MPVVAPWVQGTALVVDNGMTGATMSIHCGLHEAADIVFVLHLLRSGDFRTCLNGCSVTCACKICLIAWTPVALPWAPPEERCP